MFLILTLLSEFSFDPVWQLYSLVFQVVFFSDEAALLALSLSLLLASLSFFSSSVLCLLLSLSFLFPLSNLALLFPTLSDSPGRFLLFFQYHPYPFEKEDAKQSQCLNGK